MGYYVTPVGVKALKSYSYSGADLSLTYKYVLSPWAQFCVDHFTPMSTAPNTITFLGLVWMFVAYLLMLFYAPTFNEALTPAIDGQVPSETGAVPRWVYLFNAAAMIIYQTLDNMDGKQARRTGSSSPLGMLFDHGCDAINSPMGSINWCVAMCISPSIPLVLFWTLIASAIPFYVSTWEEYYTGALILPIINGPSEVSPSNKSPHTHTSGPEHICRCEQRGSVFLLLAGATTRSRRGEPCASEARTCMPARRACIISSRERKELIIFSLRSCAIRHHLCSHVQVLTVCVPPLRACSSAPAYP